MYEWRRPLPFTCNLGCCRHVLVALAQQVEISVPTISTLVRPSSFESRFMGKSFVWDAWELGWDPLYSEVTMQPRRLNGCNPVKGYY